MGKGYLFFFFAGLLLECVCSGSVLAGGLEAAWTFDSCQDGVAEEASGGGLRGRICGAKASDGVVGQGLEFDGIDDYVALGEGSPDLADRIGTLSKGTLSLWFKLHTAPAAGVVQPLFYFGDDRPWSGTNPGYSGILVEVGHFNAGNLLLYFTVYRPEGITLCFNSMGSLELNRWYQFAVTVGEGFNQGYLDGEELRCHYNFGGARTSYFLADIPTAKVCWIGRGFFNFSAGPFYFDGQIDEVRLYDRPLTAEEIRARYARPGGCGDCDLDGIDGIGAEDLRLLAADWLGVGDLPGDINHDGTVDILDFAEMAKCWLSPRVELQG
jgi:hypothetical protein